MPGDSAISQRPYQLGARPLVALFHRACQPLATPETARAFLFGLRLMAMDGRTENVADTPENAAAFGRMHAGRGDSAFPQVQAVYLAECGTHAIVDAGFWPCHTPERDGGFRMLRSVGPGMLLMWDTGFHDFDLVQVAMDRGAHVLARLPAHVKPHLVRRLHDGSSLATIRPSEYARRMRGECLPVRMHHRVHHHRAELVKSRLRRAMGFAAKLVHKVRDGACDSCDFLTLSLLCPCVLH